MSWESVDFFVTVGDGGAPVGGALVRVYSLDGAEVYTQGTTDVEGHVALMLPVGEYSVRFYKFQASFNQPQHISVVTPPPGSPPQYNSFNVHATTLAPPLANDSRLCRCSGYLRELTGGPKRYLDMHFSPDFDVSVLEGSAVVAGTVAIRTDENGWAQIDLIRGHNYRVTLENLEGDSRIIRVPDLPSTNLSHLIFPVVATVEAEPNGDFLLSIGESVFITPTVTDSAGVPLTGTAVADVQWSMSNPEAANIVGVTQDTLEIRGIAPGVSQLQATRRDVSIIVVPDTGIDVQDVTVTVA